jgi:hypothetical protein
VQIADVPADQIEKVFEEFYRVNDAATPAADGVGLGLSLVARLAKALKSEVRLDSVAGRHALLDAPGQPARCRPHASAGWVTTYAASPTVPTCRRRAGAYQ